MMHTEDTCGDYDTVIKFIYV